MWGVIFFRFWGVFPNCTDGKAHWDNVTCDFGQVHLTWPNQSFGNSQPNPTNWVCECFCTCDETGCVFHTSAWGGDIEKWGLLRRDGDSDRAARFPHRPPQALRRKPRDVSKKRHHTTNEQNATEPARIIAPNGISFHRDAAWFDAMCVWCVCVCVWAGSGFWLRL